MTHEKKIDHVPNGKQCVLRISMSLSTGLSKTCISPQRGIRMIILMGIKLIATPKKDRKAES